MCQISVPMDVSPSSLLRRFKITVPEVPFRPRGGSDDMRPRPEFADPSGAADDTVVLDEFGKVAQYQIFSLWCWNAVGAALVEYYLKGDSGTASISQCRNAEVYLGIPGCCSMEIPGMGAMQNLRPYMAGGYAPLHLEGACNAPGQTERVVDGTGSLRGEWRPSAGNIPEPALMAEIVQQLAAGHPVVMLLANANVRHVLTIFGTSVENGNRKFLVADPWDGVSNVDHVNDNAAWTWSMFIRTP